MYLFSILEANSCMKPATYSCLPQKGQKATRSCLPQKGQVSTCSQLHVAVCPKRGK